MSQAKKKSPLKTAIKTILIVLITPIVLVVLYLLYVAASNPIYDSFDQQKFKKLDSSMQDMHRTLKTVSDKEEKWQYSKNCDEELSGDWPTGRYFCTALISIVKHISSVQELNALQAKYYPIIDKNSYLEPKDQLDLQFPDDFGKKFVVSSAEKNYIESKSGIDCKYLIKLYQKNTPLNLYDDAYGSKIINNNGNAYITFECTAKARKSWF